MKCEYCGNEFKRKSPNQKFCSANCREKARMQIKIVKRKCKNCGKEFSVNSSNGLKKFCSKHCRDIFNNNKRLKKEGKQGTTRKCKNCGKEFEVSIHNYFYCSEECRTSKSIKKEAEIAECPVCHKKFEKKNPRHIYCSSGCGIIANREKMRQKQKELRKKQKYVNVTCPTCGKTRRVASTYKYEECFSCRHSIQKIKSKPTYSINQVVAIQQALDIRYNRYFSYSEVVDKLEKGEIIIDKISKYLGLTTAEAHLKGE